MMPNKMVMRPSMRKSHLQPRMPLTPSMSIRAAPMGAPMTCDRAVLVATRARAGPVSLALKKVVMWNHMPAHAQPVSIVLTN